MLMNRRRLRTIGLILPVLLLSLGTSDFTQAAPEDLARLTTEGGVIKATFLFESPTIDGSISSDELGPAIPLTMNGQFVPADTADVQLYVANTATDLYIGLIIPDESSSETDAVELDFDTPHNHSAIQGLEDAIRYVGGLYDLYWGPGYWMTDVHQHGEAAVTWASGAYTYEFRKALSSGDGHDMSVAPGSVMGFRIETKDNSPVEIYHYPPNTTSQGDSTDEWEKWADLVLAEASVTDTPTLTGPGNATQLSTMSTTLTWTNPPATTQVHVQVIPANNDGPGVNLIIGNVSSLLVPGPPDWYGLLPDMSYTWRVRTSAKATSASEHDPSWGPWTHERTFRTPIRTSANLVNIIPRNGADITNTRQTLRWLSTYNDVFYYEVQVSPDPNFGEQGAVSFVWYNLVHGGVSNPTNSWFTPALEPNVTYYWRVRPRVQGDGTPVAWSQTWSFRTL